MNILAKALVFSILSFTLIPLQGNGAVVTLKCRLNESREYDLVTIRETPYRVVADGKYELYYGPGGVGEILYLMNAESGAEAIYQMDANNISKQSVIAFALREGRNKMAKVVCRYTEQ